MIKCTNSEVGRVKKVVTLKVRQQDCACACEWIRVEPPTRYVIVQDLVFTNRPRFPERIDLQILYNNRWVTIPQDYLEHHVVVEGILRCAPRKQFILKRSQWEQEMLAVRGDMYSPFLIANIVGLERFPVQPPVSPIVKPEPWMDGSYVAPANTHIKEPETSQEDEDFVLE